MAICGGAVIFCGYAIWSNNHSPNTHWNRKERSTIDYCDDENTRSSADDAKTYSKMAFKKGPGFQSADADKILELKGADAARARGAAELEGK